jgi:subtilisin family serine protease
MKNIILLLVAICSLISCRKSDSGIDAKVEGHQRPGIDSVRLVIQETLEKKGSFEWASLSPTLLWTAIQKSNGIVAVGYQTTANSFRDNQLPTINIQDVDWLRTKESLLNELLKLERALNPALDLADIVPWEENTLPVFNIVIKNPKSLFYLLSSPLVRYVEPMEYDQYLLSADDRRSSGCNSNLPARGLVAGVHYGVVTPNAKASWNYPAHGILDAWRYVSGKGIKVFLIDTGIGYGQESFGANFNQGFSGARTLERLVTLPRQRFLGIINVGPAETPEDRCGHGTAMAGVLAAPRGTEGNMVGIAYNANLVTCRAAADVFIDEAREVKGVSDAFTVAAQRADVKVISMSMGRITVSSQIRDAIQYAHSKGKLIFCAAGTSFAFTANWAGVIFPATLPEVQAVTGVKQLTNFEACSHCHTGPEVDFVVEMERVSDRTFPLTVSDRGNEPSTIGGSSVATASMAAMTALVWSRYPYFSRDQILTLLERYSTYYPQRDPRWGWGKFQPVLAVD